MRSALVWLAVFGFLGTGAAFFVSQQQFQSQLAQMRQELDRLQGPRGATLPPQELTIDQDAHADTRLLRRIFLDDLRQQIAGEESEEVAGRLIQAWFETPPAADSKAPVERRDAAPEGR